MQSPRPAQEAPFVLVATMCALIALMATVMLFLVPGNLSVLTPLIVVVLIGDLLVLGLFALRRRAGRGIEWEIVETVRRWGSLGYCLVAALVAVAVWLKLPEIFFEEGTPRTIASVLVLGLAGMCVVGGIIAFLRRNEPPADLERAGAKGV